MKNNTDAIQILTKHLIGDDPEAKKMLEEEREIADKEREVYLRKMYKKCTGRSSYEK